MQSEFSLLILVLGPHFSSNHYSFVILCNQVLICKPEEVKRIIKIVNDSCPPLHSCLSDDKNGMTHAILEVVAGGIVQTASDIHRYVRCTLLNSTKPFEDVVKSAQDSLKWLCHRKFLEWNEDTKLYSTTPLGRASFGSSLCPEESLVCHPKSLILFSSLLSKW